MVAELALEKRKSATLVTGFVSAPRRVPALTLGGARRVTNVKHQSKRIYGGMGRPMIEAHEAALTRPGDRRRLVQNRPLAVSAGTEIVAN